MVTRKNGLELTGYKNIGDSVYLLKDDIGRCGYCKRNLGILWADYWKWFRNERASIPLYIYCETCAIYFSCRMH